MDNCYAMQKIHVCTKITDESILANMVQPIVDFGDKHGIVFTIGKSADSKIITICEANGRTSAYCKGMVLEVKQMLKDIFNCKLNVLFYAY